MKPQMFVFDITYTDTREILADNEDDANEMMADELESEGFNLKKVDFDIVESYYPTKEDLE